MVGRTFLTSPFLSFSISSIGAFDRRSKAYGHSLYSESKGVGRWPRLAEKFYSSRKQMSREKANFLKKKISIFFPKTY